jgi:tRNA uridine 5-carboxymethylaminomethyl modification enzyme
MEQKSIPSWLDYDTIPGLRTEARMKLKQITPITVGQAARVSGVSPADITLILVWMKRGPSRTVPSTEMETTRHGDPGCEVGGPLA